MILIISQNGYLKDCLTKLFNLLPHLIIVLLQHFGNKVKVKFEGSCLKQDKITFTHGKIVDIYIIYEINFWNYEDSSDPTLGNCLFGAFKLVKKMLILRNTNILDMVLGFI